MPRLILQSLFFSLLSLSLACGSDGSSETDMGPDTDIDPPAVRGTTYYVIRHTERDPGADPPINEEGEARAEALADALEYAGVDEIVTTVFIRGQQSGEPLSERTGAPIVVAPFQPESWAGLANDVAQWQIEREVPGATYLMIGHSSNYNSILIEELGGPPDFGTVAERYQDMAVLVREADGTAKLSVLQFGGPSSLDPQD